jgi:NhaP-type Na+/H+ or K+/H+ antiporter
LDDAVGLVVFATSFGIARALLEGTVSIVSILINPLLEILFSLLLGAVAGWVLTQLETMFHSNTNRTSMTIAFVFLTVGLSSLEFHLGEVTIGFSSLLVCMMLGTVFCNICPLSDDLMHRSDVWSQPLLAVFFVVSGAELRLEVFSELTLVLVGIVFILARSTGKYLGARFSSKAVGCSEKVVRYLGITLLPQAGVALGMCVTAQELGEADGGLVRNIILFSVLIYELVGPLLTKQALTAAGEITAIPQEIAQRRERKLAEAKAKASANK